MISRARVLSVVAVLALCQSALFAAPRYKKEREIDPPKDYSALRPAASASLRSLLERAAAAAAAKAEKALKPEELAVTLIDLSDSDKPAIADIRGEARIYPASVVKMFYMAAIERQLEDGKIDMSKELQRGLRDMIVDSSNEATQYIVDVLTDTASGSEMPQKEFQKWSYRRNRMNRYFSAMGYTNINVNQKTHCEDAYGIEQQFRSYKGENRNMLTTNATARLIAEIALGRSNNADRTRRMMDLLKRDPFADAKNANSQATDFSGKALIDRRLTGARLWSKAGWTSRSRHDAAYIELPNGKRFAIAVFTENHANEKEILPALVGAVIDEIGKE